MKLFKIILIVIPVVIFIIIASFFVIDFLSNDFALSNFSKQLYSYSLPKNTKIIEKQDICGKLNGNGNGMDFLATMLIKSDLSLKELNDYYSKVNFRSAKSNNNNSSHKPEISIVKPTSSKLESEYLSHGEIEYNNLKNVDSYSKFYIIMLYDGGYSADLDIRGH